MQAAHQRDTAEATACVLRQVLHVLAVHAWQVQNLA